jgi:DNA repair protein RadC
LEPFFFLAPGERSVVYVCELTRRRYRGKTPKLIRGPEDVVKLLGPKLRAAKREHFLVLLLNARHEVMLQDTVSIGSLNASIVHPREVFKPAVIESAASVVLVHNHPSGDPEPSEEDLAITKRLVKAGEILGIGILDHVIVASRGVVSFKARQLL